MRALVIFPHYINALTNRKVMDKKKKKKPKGTFIDPSTKSKSWAKMTSVTESKKSWLLEILEGNRIEEPGRVQRFKLP